MPVKSFQGERAQKSENNSQQNNGFRYNDASANCF